MLVLTRKCDETIKIGNDIIIRVVQTGRGTVKLGIDAPMNVRVLRGELIEHLAATLLAAADALDATEAQPATVVTVRNASSQTNATTPESLANATSLSVTTLRHEFDAEYVSDLEDQLLVTTAS